MVRAGCPPRIVCVGDSEKNKKRVDEELGLERAWGIAGEKTGGGARYSKALRAGTYRAQL